MGFCIDHLEKKNPLNYIVGESLPYYTEGEKESEQTSMLLSWRPTQIDLHVLAARRLHFEEEKRHVRPLARWCQ